MQFWRGLTSIVVQIITLLILIGMLVFSLTGEVFQQPFPVAAVGSLQVTAFSTGLALYKNGENKHFYGISPLNDFVVTTQNPRTALLSFEDFTEHRYSTDLEKSVPEKLWLSFQNYFGVAPITYTVHGTYDVSYVGRVEGNTLIIDQSVVSKNEPYLALGQTIQFYEDDQLFNAKGEPYSPVVIEANDRLIIQSPNLPGLIVIQALPFQHITVDSLNHLIEIRDTNPIQSQNTYRMRLQLKVVPSLAEAIK